jgi:hypothetical protein
VILADDPKRFLADRTWVETFGAPTSVGLEDYGNVTSLRIHYQDDLEVEFGFASVQWAQEPVDPGTQPAIGGGMRVLFEHGPILSRFFDRG